MHIRGELFNKVGRFLGWCMFKALFIYFVLLPLTPLSANRFNAQINVCSYFFWVVNLLEIYWNDVELCVFVCRSESKFFVSGARRDALANEIYLKLFLWMCIGARLWLAFMGLAWRSRVGCRTIILSSSNFVVKNQVRTSVKFSSLDSLEAAYPNTGCSLLMTFAYDTRKQQ